MMRKNKTKTVFFFFSHSIGIVHIVDNLMNQKRSNLFYLITENNNKIKDQNNKLSITIFDN